MSDSYQRHLLAELDRTRPAPQDDGAGAAVDQRIEQLVAEIVRRAEHEARIKYDPAYMTRNVPN